MDHDAVWKCCDCGHVFAKPKRIAGHGRVPTDGDSPDTCVCPMCDSDDIVIAEFCIECENVFLGSDLQYGLCPDCLIKLAREHAHEYVLGDSDLCDEFAWYMHKRLTGRRGA